MSVDRTRIAGEFIGWDARIAHGADPFGVTRDCGCLTGPCECGAECDENSCECGCDADRDWYGDDLCRGGLDGHVMADRPGSHPHRTDSGLWADTLTRP